MLDFGQIRTADKSNEISAIPTFPDMLALEGSMVTIDVHWYISSRTGGAEDFLAARREHWSVENGLHYSTCASSQGWSGPSALRSPRRCAWRRARTAPRQVNVPAAT